MVDNIFNKDDSVYFKEDTHQYFTKFGEELASTTRVIGKVKMHFDRQGISLAMAKGDKSEQKKILAQWDEKRDSSIDRGNWIHDNLEKYLLTGEIDPKLNDVVTQLNPIFKEGYRYYPEALIHSMEYMVSGMSDLVVQRQRSKDTVFDFYDYKTNESKGIEYDSVSRKKIPYKHYNRFLLPPLDHLEDCNFNHYALQLSVYAFMSQITWGIKIGRMAILFVDNHLKLHKIPVPYMKYEAQALLEHHKSLKPLPEMNVKEDETYEEDDW